jgi:hypothetical protein
MGIGIYIYIYVYIYIIYIYIYLHVYIYIYILGRMFLHIFSLFGVTRWTTYRKFPTVEKELKVIFRHF